MLASPLPGKVEASSDPPMAAMQQIKDCAAPRLASTTPASLQLTSFLDRMLVKDQDKRETAANLLKSTFIKSAPGSAAVKQLLERTKGRENIG